MNVCGRRIAGQTAECPATVTTVPAAFSVVVALPVAVEFAGGFSCSPFIQDANAV